MENLKPVMLNFADLCPATRALGPGLRAAIWVQGCPIHCKGCIAPDWIPFTPAHILSPEETGDQLIADSRIEGITISGGEPMMQAEGLAAMIAYLRSKKEINVICFTGFRYENLLNWKPDTKVKDLLSQVDVLIDGPYIEKLNNGLTFAGSANQRMIELSKNKLPGLTQWSKRRMEIHIRKKDILSVGVPPLNWTGDLSNLFPSNFLTKAEKQNERT